MQLNFDAVREILLFIEKEVDYSQNKNIIRQSDIYNGIQENDSFSKDDIWYGIEVLLTTPYLNLCEPPTYHPFGELKSVFIRGLTFEGHNFLDTIRKPTIWDVVKEKAKMYGGLSFATLSKAGASLGNALMQDSNAIDNFINGADNIKEYIQNIL